MLAAMLMLAYFVVLSFRGIARYADGININSFIVLDV